MSLEVVLENITQGLREKAFPNEQSISQGAVLPVLKELNWPVFKTNIVCPEYATGEGRVDFALCDHPRRPKIFIEVKRLGRAEDGVRQALQYSFDSGVPFVVLTDGRTWNFYLPAEAGDYEERRVFKLDMFERSPNEAANVLQRYLDRDGVVKGEALEHAREEYRSQNRRATARNAIPDAWHDLIQARNEQLANLLAKATESKVGIRPEENDVIVFLASLQRSLSGSITQPVSQRTPERTLPSQPDVIDPRSARRAARPQRGLPRRQGKVVVEGREFEYKNVKDAMVLVLSDLHRRDRNFLLRLSQHPECRGRKRLFIARSPEELYPATSRQNIRDMNESLPDGWFVATNNSTEQKRKFLKIASKVAGLTFGRDIVIDF